MIIVLGLEEKLFTQIDRFNLSDETKVTSKNRKKNLLDDKKNAINVLIWL
jgi:hypothetical protein